MSTLKSSAVENLQLEPEALLRARYAAFVRGDVDFILETHHPESRDQVDRDAVKSWSTGSKWKSLEIHEVKPQDDSCVIHFTATYERKQEIIPHSEFAEFRRHEGRWFYFDSEFPKQKTQRRDQVKVGRNDPCPCGSSKKYKKCHGSLS